VAYVGLGSVTPGVHVKTSTLIPGPRSNTAWSAFFDATFTWTTDTFAGNPAAPGATVYSPIGGGAVAGIALLLGNVSPASAPNNGKAGAVAGGTVGVYYAFARFNFVNCLASWRAVPQRNPKVQSNLALEKRMRMDNLSKMNDKSDTSPASQVNQRSCGRRASTNLALASNCRTTHALKPEGLASAISKGQRTPDR
jgi:hypothetical protein